MAQFGELLAELRQDKKLTQNNSQKLFMLLPAQFATMKTTFTTRMLKSSLPLRIILTLPWTISLGGAVPTFPLMSSMSLLSLEKQWAPLSRSSRNFLRSGSKRFC